MKRLFLLAIIYILGGSVSAQDCPMCGDWVGVYVGGKYDRSENRRVEANWKMYIRIKNNDGHYSVRVKERLADNSRDFIYWTDCNVYEVKGNKIILWEEFKDDDFHENVYYTIEYNHGILYFDGGIVYRTNYNSSGRVINKYEFSAMKPVTLYKEDDDW